MGTWREWLKTFLSKGKTQTDNRSDSTNPPEVQSSPPKESAVQTETSDAHQTYPVLPLKEWIIRQVSPYAWDRTVIRSLPALGRMGISPTNIIAPKPDTQLSASTLQVILTSLEEMYGIRPNLSEIYKSGIAV
ncbi:MAG: hypothetical protein N2200_01400 [Bacteroidia bacterium]|nr:hypothetical protein [Bacteroidia bacterium]